MAVFHQMGHQSENLVQEFIGDRFSGAIVSPVNTDEARVSALRCAVGASVSVVLDPQLYVPRSERANLLAWDYFPTDVDTADLGSITWWQGINGRLIATARRLGLDGICSPVIVPATYDSAYYRMCVRIADNLLACAEADYSVYLTSIVRVRELISDDYVMQVASLLSASHCDQIYLVPYSETDTRRELADSRGIFGVMKLIQLLRRAKMDVLVGFSGPEALLYYYAGAHTCATGKFFNLRRFTPSRFEPPPAQGGGQLPYWFEEKLMAYLRAADVVRVQENIGFSESTLSNPHAASLLDAIMTGEAWLGASWRHYLHWFADLDRRSEVGLDPHSLLEEVEQNWQHLRTNDILMDEVPNDGSWIRPWRNAASDFRRWRDRT
jgi:hypothetical protein